MDNLRDIIKIYKTQQEGAGDLKTYEQNKWPYGPEFDARYLINRSTEIETEKYFNFKNDKSDEIGKSTRKIIIKDINENIKKITNQLQISQSMDLAQINDKLRTLFSMLLDFKQSRQAFAQPQQAFSQPQQALQQNIQSNTSISNLQRPHTPILKSLTEEDIKKPEFIEIISTLQAILYNHIQKRLIIPLNIPALVMLKRPNSSSEDKPKYYNCFLISYHRENDGSYFIVEIVRRGDNQIMKINDEIVGVIERIPQEKRTEDLN